LKDRAFLFSTGTFTQLNSFGHELARKEVAMPKDIKKEILDLETSFWNSMKDKDVNAALQLAADPCIVTGPQGVSTIDKETFTKMMSTANWDLRDFTIDNVQVQQLGEDVAIIGYKVHEDIVVDGSRLAIEAADTSTWVRQNGSWLCAMHTESLIGDPFGRDRQTQH
jgi:ketosteroid isomerase-like protein